VSKHYSLEHYARPDVVSAYDEDRYGGPAGQWLLARETVLYACLVPPCATLLDLGTGTGKLLHGLREAATRRVGVDASLPMLRAARARVPDAWFVVADAHRLPFKPAGFEWVVSSRVLLHVRCWPAVAGEICSVAATGVVLDVPTITSFAPLEAVVRRVLRLPQTYRCFRLAHLRRVFDQHGFCQDASRKDAFFPYRLHRTLKNPTVSAWLEGAALALRLTKLWGNPAILRFRRSQPS
jgi:ubiquinone/menaquinone biosynthesis C-methylase UbiE